MMSHFRFDPAIQKKIDDLKITDTKTLDALASDISNSNQLEQVLVKNTELVEGWKALQNASPSVRRNPDNLAKAKKYLDETGESITAFQRKVPVAGQKKWLDDIVGHWEQLKKIKPEFKELNLSDTEINSIIKLYKDFPDLILRLKGSIDELKLHNGLSIENKMKLLKDKQFIEVSVLRKKDMLVKPIDWVDDPKSLDDLWTQTLLNDDLIMTKVEKIARKKSIIPQTIANINEKQGKNIQELGVVLGRGNVTIPYIKNFNKTSQEKVFVDDGRWAKRRWYIAEKKVRENDFRLNIIQGVETARRLHSLNLVVGGKRLKGRVYFNLESYDVFQTMRAMHSNPNNFIKGEAFPIPQNFANNPRAMLGVTDMELANIVRNKDWFEITTFFKIENGQMKIFTSTELEQKFGIKYIGDLINYK